MKLAVILPSRGLIFSATVEEILREVASVGCQWRIFFAHSRPIPECFNEPLEQALAGDFTHFWLVEEDMVYPPGILGDLIATGEPAVAADYPLNTSGGMCVSRDQAGVVRCSGTGCLLLDRATLLAVFPLTTRVRYMIRGDKWTRVDAEPGASDYGLHDAHLGMTLYDRGTPILVVPTLCDQRIVTRYAASKRNANGWHDITTLNDTPDEGERDEVHQGHGRRSGRLPLGSG